MSAGKSHEAASENSCGYLRRRSCAPSPDFEKPISQFCPPPVGVLAPPPVPPKFCCTQGTRSCVMKVSYWTLGLSGLFAYHGSIANDGSMIVRLYWFCALRLSKVSSPSPY